jgi:hypothetical protein
MMTSARHLLLGAAAFAVAACTTDTGRMAQALMGTVWPDEPVRVTRERAAEIPFASMGAQLGDGNQGLLVLGANTAQQAEWYSGDLIMIRTRSGRIVRTAGLPFDLGGADVRPATGAPAARGASVALFYDFPDLGVFGAAGYCSERDAGPETIQILGTAIATRRVVESCEVESLDWAFQSQYWKDPATNYVWRSRQYIHPKSDPVTLEVFRPELPPQN